MARRRTPDDPGRPLYMISVAAQLAGMHPQTLRIYERKELIRPQRSSGNTRLYSDSDIERLRLIQRLTQEEGVNLAGVMRILELENEIEALRADLVRLKTQAEEMHRRLVKDVERAARQAGGDIVIVRRGGLARRG